MGGFEDGGLIMVGVVANRQADSPGIESRLRRILNCILQPSHSGDFICLLDMTALACLVGEAAETVHGGRCAKKARAPPPPYLRHTEVQVLLLKVQSRI